MSSDYSHVHKGSLKLKHVPDSITIKKKKKKSKEKELKKALEKVKSIKTTESNELMEETSKRHVEVDTRTGAELAFARAKQKRVVDEMIKKPIKTHKERIMEFNQHLDNLSEHYDIPKVSWTK